MNDWQSFDCERIAIHQLGPVYAQPKSMFALLMAFDFACCNGKNFATFLTKNILFQLSIRLSLYRIQNQRTGDFKRECCIRQVQKPVMFAILSNNYEAALF